MTEFGEVFSVTQQAAGEEFPSDSKYIWMNLNFLRAASKQID
jgi:hypothetical protein